MDVLRKQQQKNWEKWTLFEEKMVFMGSLGGENNGGGE